MNRKLSRHIDEFVSDFLPIWFCSFCAIAFYVFPENNIAPKHGIAMSLYYAFLGLYVSILPVLLIQVFKGKARNIAFGILWGLGLLNVAVDVVVMETTGALFSLEHVSLILGSNISESTEFFGAYFNADIVMKIVVLEALCVLVWFISRKIPKGLFSKFVASVVLLISIGAGLFSNILKSENWGQVFIAKTFLFAEYSPAEDLSPWRQTPVIEVDCAESAPHNIIVIIGESFSKSHSSLYGYNKLTNPLLSSLPKDRFYVFKNVESADTHTVPAIKQMLTTYDMTKPSVQEWYEYLTMFDISKTLGYSTIWISNQSKVGLFDNVVTRLAELADNQVWIGVESAGVYKKDLDGNLIPTIGNYVDSCGVNNSRHIFFIHLMGSHPSYSSRYSKEYAIFSAEDYPDALDKQKKTLSDYDNSIVYNDYVVRSIIDTVALMDCVVLYTSDHGQDIYESSSDYCGHPMDNVPESAHLGKRVPMMLYVSDSYAARNPDFLSRARDAQLNDYNLKDLVYSLSDIMGAKTINGEAVCNKSVFRQ